ncbi:DUF4138 domain-containing protein [Flavobacteriaceae bacterium]|nr:DUF4138 domain-containing protein [Flavobacteriaceae bacterium]
MKKQLVRAILAILITQMGVNAQVEKTVELIDYRKDILVSDIETTHLIFENEVEYIDVGNKFFATDVIKNIVKIKYIKTDDETLDTFSNLTIITKEGKYYSFKLLFDRADTSKTFKILPSELKIDQFNSVVPEIDFENSCLNILEKPININKKDLYQNMLFTVNGMYYIDDLIYIRLIIKNKSRLDYTLGKVDFWIRTKNTNKRKLSAYQTRIIEPHYICNYSTEILGYNESEMVFVFKRFVPLKNEDFVLQITESDGGGRRGSIKLDIEDFLIK